jgi:hypothetical protein
MLYKFNEAVNKILVSTSNVPIHGAPLSVRQFI